MNTWKLYKAYASVAMRVELEYRASFLLSMMGRFLIEMSCFIGLRFLFSGFEAIKGYAYEDVLLCFAVMQLSFALAEGIGRGFASFSGAVRRGEFDRMLVRPRGTIVQVLGSQIDMGQLGPVLSAAAILAIGLRVHPAPVTPLRLLALVTMVAGGEILFFGLFMVGAAICFFSVEESNSINVLTYGAKDHGKYPIDVYGEGLFRFCTFVIPYTLVQYYPLQVLIGRSDSLLLTLCPLGTLAFLAVCYAFWRFGVSRYTSCGS